MNIFSKPAFIAAVLFSMTAGLLSAAEKQDKIDEGLLQESVQSYDKNAIPQKMRENMRDMRKCYEDEISKNNGIGEGMLKVNFTISEKGSPLNISFSSQAVKSKEVENCIGKIIAKIIFPPDPSGGEIEVNFPLALSLYKGKVAEKELPLDQSLETEPDKKVEKK